MVILLSNTIDCSKSSLEKRFREFLSQDRKKFYLDDMIQEIGISTEVAEDFLIPLLEEKKIEGRLELRCPNCESHQGTFENYNLIPQEIECEICGHNFTKADEYLNILLEVKGKFFRAQGISSEYY